MAGVGNNLQRPTRCMNVYAKYRNELSKVMHEAQYGKKNSQYGKHWYTNLRTGESTSFFSKPDKFWVEGRNWFNREGKNLYSIVTKNILTFGAIRKRIYRKRVIGLTNVERFPQAGWCFELPKHFCWYSTVGSAADL